MLKPSLVTLQKQFDEHPDADTQDDRLEREALAADLEKHGDKYRAILRRAELAWARFADARRNNDPAAIGFWYSFLEVRDEIPARLWDSFDWSFIVADSQFGEADAKPARRKAA